MIAVGNININPLATGMVHDSLLILISHAYSLFGDLKMFTTKSQASEECAGVGM